MTQNFLAILALLFCASMAQQPNSVPYGSRLPGVIQESTICQGFSNMALRMPLSPTGAPFEIPLWRNQYYMELQDLENNRLAVIVENPVFGDTRFWVTPTGSWQMEGPYCFRTPVTNLVDYLNVARTPLVKVDQLPNHIDVYQGVSYESPSANSPMSKVFHLDARNNHTVYENWVQKLVRQRNPDGSCPLTLDQLYGEIYFGYGGCMTVAEFVAQNGQQALEAFFEIPVECTATSPLTTDVKCWD